jgi:hypothetical protein
LRPWLLLPALLSTNAYAVDALVLGTCWPGPVHGSGDDITATLRGSRAFGRVDVWMTSIRAPLAADLAPYDVVVLDYQCSYPGMLGDALADYVDDGGGVVAGAMDFGFPSVYGRFQQLGYFPFEEGYPYGTFDRQLGAYDPTHPIMTGVTAYASGADNVVVPVLRPGATLVASYADGGALVAEHRPSGAGIVVGVNDLAQSDVAFPNYDLGYDHGVGAALWINAALYAAGAPVPVPFQSWVTGSCPGDLLVETRNATPRGLLALVAGRAGGSTLMTQGPCAGLPIPLAGAVLWDIRRANGLGADTMTLSGFGACYGAFATVDVATCRLSYNIFR